MAGVAAQFQVQPLVFLRRNSRREWRACPLEVDGLPKWRRAQYAVVALGEVDRAAGGVPERGGAVSQFSIGPKVSG